MNSLIATVFITYMASCDAQLGNLLGMAIDDATMFDGAPPTIIVAPQAASPPQENTANKRMIRAVNWMMPAAANMFMPPVNGMFNPPNMGLARAEVARPAVNMGGMGGMNAARPAALAGLGMGGEDGGAMEDAGGAGGAAAPEDAPVGGAGGRGAAAAEDAPPAKAAPQARAGVV